HRSRNAAGNSRRKAASSRPGEESASRAGELELRTLMANRARALSVLDINFIGTALAITAVGCLLIYSATYFTDPSLNLLRKQFLWVAIGAALMLLFMMVDYHVFFDIAPFLYGIGNVLLVYLLLWGKVTANVKSWIHIGTFQF